MIMGALSIIQEEYHILIWVQGLHPWVERPKYGCALCQKIGVVVANPDACEDENRNYELFYPKSEEDHFVSNCSVR